MAVIGTIAWIPRLYLHFECGILSVPLPGGVLDLKADALDTRGPKARRCGSAAFTTRAVGALLDAVLRLLAPAHVKEPRHLCRMPGVFVLFLCSVHLPGGDEIHAGAQHVLQNGSVGF